MIASLVEAQSGGTICTIWLPEDGGTQLRCAAAPGLPGFIAHVGTTLVGPYGASCGTAAYLREPVYVSDILSDRRWDDYRHLMKPFGIRAVWSRPLVTTTGKVIGTFAMLHREVRTPAAAELELIESASHIAGIAIERHRSEAELRLERAWRGGEIRGVGVAANISIAQRVHRNPERHIVRIFQLRYENS